MTHFSASFMGLLMLLLFELVSLGMVAGVARPLPTVLAVPARPARRDS